jgi:alkylhydroperoxidase family enzyme
MQTLPVIDPLKASGKTKEVLERVAQRIGWVPKMIKLLANSPAATEAYLEFNVALAQAALPRQTRSLIAATVAELNGCAYSAMIAHGQAK